MKKSENEIKKFIDEHTKKIKPLFKKYTLAYWEATSFGKEEDYAEYEKLALELEKIYNNKEDYEKVKKFKQEKIEDKLIRRQIDILHNSYLSSQGDIKLIERIVNLSTKIEKKFNTYRAEVDGKKLTDNEIKNILKIELNSEKLKKTWEANKKQGEFVAGEVIELVKLRNELARSLEFKNYYERNLQLGEQKPEEILEIFKELEKLTDTPFKKLKEEMDDFLGKRYKTKKLEPWHYQDLFFQEGPEIYKFDLDKYFYTDVVEKARKFYNEIGLQVDDILKKSDLYEREGKYQHAYCMDIDREGDVRIMENVKNDEKWMETSLHELGHAVYNKYIDMKLPFLLIDSAHTFTTEAIAMLFGRQTKNINFIKRFSDIKLENEHEIREETEKMLKLRQLVFSRWAQVMMHFEKSMYENPEQDLNKLWWNLVKKFQLIDFSRNKPDWASKIHLVSAPVYYHNYLLGELLASQLHAYICRNVLKTNPQEADYSDVRIGKFLVKEVFAPGKRYTWEELIKRATGENLTAKYFSEQFCDN